MGPKYWLKNKDIKRRSFPSRCFLKYRSSSSGCCEVIISSDGSDGVNSDTIIRLQVELTSSLLTPAAGEHHFYVFQVWWTRPQPFREPTVPSVHPLPVPTWALSPPTDASAPPWSLSTPTDASPAVRLGGYLAAGAQLSTATEGGGRGSVVMQRAGEQVRSHLVIHSWKCDITNAGRRDKSPCIYWQINHQKQRCEQYLLFTCCIWIPLWCSATFCSYSDTFYVELLHFLPHFIYLILNCFAELANSAPKTNKLWCVILTLENLELIFLEFWRKESLLAIEKKKQRVKLTWNHKAK